MDVLPIRFAEKTTPKPNFAGWDAVRAMAALGVVLLHSCVPYLLRPMPGLAWPVHDQASSAVDFCFWSIEVFIMPLFLVMAGFFAWQTLTRRGQTELIKSRARRLLVPLVFGIIVILPLDLYCWVLGWVSEGIVEPIKLKSLKFDGAIDQDLWGLSHLWFLLYLFLYVAVLAGAWKLGNRFELLRRVRITPRSGTAVLLVLGAVTLYFRPQVVWGFQHAFLPVPSKWLYSGLFFAFGVGLANFDGRLDWLKLQANRLAGPALVMLVATVILGRWHVSDGDSQLAEATLAILTCGTALAVTLAILSLAVARVQRVSIAIEYLAAASFWVYLLHHPLLGLVHIDLKWLIPTASPIVKTGLSFCVATGFCLLTYEAFVRQTRLGHWLGLAWEIPEQIKSLEANEEATVLSIDQAAAPAETRRAA